MTHLLCCVHVIAKFADSRVVISNIRRARKSYSKSGTSTVVYSCNHIISTIKCFTFCQKI